MTEAQIAGCAGKYGFPSFSSAQTAARRQHQNKGARVTLYKCQYCRQVHVGERTKKDRRGSK